MTVWIYTFCGRCDHPIKALDHIGTLCTGCGPKTVAGTGSNRNNKRGIRGVRGVEFETAGRCANTVNPGLTTTHLMTDNTAAPGTRAQNPLTAEREWLETARTEYNAAGSEVRHAQSRLDACTTALVLAAERYGAALVAAGEDPAYVGLGGDA